MGTAMYQLAVPPGVLPGMQFQASVGGQMMSITCPPGIAAGSVIQVPVAQPEVPVAQPVTTTKVKELNAARAAAEAQPSAVVPVQPVQPVAAPYVRDERPATEKTPEELDAQDLDGCWWSVGCLAFPPFAVVAVGCMRNNPGIAPSGLSPYGQPAMRTQTFVNLLCPFLPAVTHWRHVPGTKTWEGYDDCFGTVGNRNCENETVNGPNSISGSGTYCGHYWRC